jgi:hypothetical protein
MHLYCILHTVHCTLYFALEPRPFLVPKDVPVSSPDDMAEDVCQIHHLNWCLVTLQINHHEMNAHETEHSMSFMS